MPNPGVYIEEGARQPPKIIGVPTAVAAFIGRAPRGPRDRQGDASPTPVKSWSEYDRVFGGLSADATLGHAVKQFFDNGGREALIVRVGKISTPLGDADISAPRLQARGRGIWALDRAKDVNLLCIPPLSRNPDGDIGADTRRAAAAYCSARHAMFIADPLMRWQSAADVLGADGARGSTFGLAPDANTALYFPYLQAHDPTRGSTLARFAPCGAVAGVIARTDHTLGVWKSPAGQHAEIRNVIGPEVVLNEADMDRLNPGGINCLRKIVSRGTVVWGARSWAGQDNSASQWKYLSIRRLALYLQRSIGRGTQWAALEPNGEPLWAGLRQSIAPFLHDLFLAGAFVGARANEAYFVRCDAINNTPADIQAGELHIDIGFAPLRPAEFIILRLTHRVGT